MGYPSYPNNRLIVNGVDITENFRVILVDGYTLKPPSPKTYLIDIPGGNGKLDLTETLLGDTAFDNRVQEFIFYSINPDDFEGVKTRLSNFLHGRSYDYKLTFDPDYTYHGRFKVTEYNHKRYDIGKVGYIKVSVESKPFKHKKQISIPVDAIGGNMFNFDSGRERVRPVFTTDAPLRVISNCKKTELPVGTWTINDLLFENGLNEVYMNSFDIRNLTWGNLKPKITSNISNNYDLMMEDFFVKHGDDNDKEEDRFITFEGAWIPEYVQVRIFKLSKNKKYKLHIRYSFYSEFGSWDGGTTLDFNVPLYLICNKEGGDKFLKNMEKATAEFNDRKYIEVNGVEQEYFITEDITHFKKPNNAIKIYNVDFPDYENSTFEYVKFDLDLDEFTNIIEVERLMPIEENNFSCFSFLDESRGTNTITFVYTTSENSKYDTYEIDFDMYTVNDSERNTNVSVKMNTIISDGDEEDNIEDGTFQTTANQHFNGITVIRKNNKNNVSIHYSVTYDSSDPIELINVTIKGAIRESNRTYSGYIGFLMLDENGKVLKAFNEHEWYGSIPDKTITKNETNRVVNIASSIQYRHDIVLVKGAKYLCVTFDSTGDDINLSNLYFHLNPDKFYLTPGFQDGSLIDKSKETIWLYVSGVNGRHSPIERTYYISPKEDCYILVNTEGEKYSLEEISSDFKSWKEFFERRLFEWYKSNGDGTFVNTSWYDISELSWTDAGEEKVEFGPDDWYYDENGYLVEGDEDGYKIVEKKWCDLVYRYEYTKHVRNTNITYDWGDL